MQIAHGDEKVLRLIEKILAPQVLQQWIQRHDLIVHQFTLITREIVGERVRFRVEQCVRRADHDLNG
jgi:hypothetical protein